MITGRSSSRSFIFIRICQRMMICQRICRMISCTRCMRNFGTIEEEYFYDRLEDGKYDEGFKERQVKEEKCR